MAPRKTKNDGKEKAKPVVTASLRVTRSTVRRTQSSTQEDGANSTGSAAKLNSPAKKGKRKTVAEAGKNKKKKVKEEEAADGADEEEETMKDDDVASKQKTIVVEHCKQCNAFKTRAIQVKEGLEEAVPGITVVLNPDKPRRGCFEIREEGGKKFISLLDMKRPFAPMKALDMKKEIANIIKKIK